MIYSSKYELGEIVYLRSDQDQKPKMITAVRFQMGGTVKYELGSSYSDREYYEGEISRDKDHIITTTN